MERVMQDTGLVVAAAGAGRRFGNDSKLLADLDGTPVLCRCLLNLLPCIDPKLAVVTVPPDAVELFRNALAAAGIPDDVRLVPGGHERADSVLRGLRALPDSAVYAAVQDGARPFSTADLLRRCVTSARTRGSGVAARRVTDTIKVADADGRVLSTPDRNTLRATETPQVFRRRDLIAAYESLPDGARVTDDAQAMEVAGQAVFLVEHTTNNRKITFRDDL